MTNRYRPVSEWGKAVFGEDDFDADFTVVEERDNLGNGHLKLVPRKYKVLSDNFNFGPEPGGVVELALPIETEAALIAGGHIERVEEDEEQPEEDEDVEDEESEVAEPTEEEE